MTTIDNGPFYIYDYRYHYNDIVRRRSVRWPRAVRCRTPARTFSAEKMKIKPTTPEVNTRARVGTVRQEDEIGINFCLSVSHSFTRSFFPSLTRYITTTRSRVSQRYAGPWDGRAFDVRHDKWFRMKTVDNNKTNKKRLVLSPVGRRRRLTWSRDKGTTTSNVTHT